jgi:hypothetical protein
LLEKQKEIDDLDKTIKKNKETIKKLSGKAKDDLIEETASLQFGKSRTIEEYNEIEKKYKSLEASESSLDDRIKSRENQKKELNDTLKPRINALEFYLDPTRENTTVLLRPDTETFDASGNYVKDVMSEGYYNDLVRDFFDDYPDVGPDNAVEAYELAKDIYDTIPRTHDILLDKTRVKLDDFYDEETNEYNYDAIY